MTTGRINQVAILGWASLPEAPRRENNKIYPAQHLSRSRPPCLTDRTPRLSPRRSSPVVHFRLMEIGVGNTKLICCPNWSRPFNRIAAEFVNARRRPASPKVTVVNSCLKPFWAEENVCDSNLRLFDKKKEKRNAFKSRPRCEVPEDLELFRLKRTRSTRVSLTDGFVVLLPRG